MMAQARKVCVYIFDRSDGRTTEERLKTAVRAYAQSCGMDVVLQEMQQEADQNGWICAGNSTESAEEAPDSLLRVERTETGKPYFPDCPGIHFSISHSGAYWACAVAGEPVGLDLQEHTLAKGESREEAAARFRKMAHRFFHPLEAKFVEPDSYNNFFTVWAAREAYVKFTGQGIDKYFSEHCVVPEESMWQQVFGQAEAKKTDHCTVAEKEGTVTWQAMKKWFWKTVFEKNYTLCVCTEEVCECRIVDMRQ